MGNNLGKIVQVCCLIDCALIIEKKNVLEIQVPKNISTVIVLIRGFTFLIFENDMKNPTITSTYLYQE